MTFKSKLNEADINNLKLIKCVKVFAREVLYSTCKDLFYNHPLSENGKLDPNGLCKEICKKTIRKCCGKMFPKDFKFIYDGNTPEDNLENFDIKACLDLLDLLKNKNNFIEESDIGIRLIKNIEEIRSIRNKLWHEFVFVWEQKLLKDELVKSIKNVCLVMDELFKKFKYKQSINKGSHYYINLSEKVVKDIDTLWEFNIIKEQSELNKLLQMRSNDKFGNFVLNCRKELMKVYKKLNSSPTFLLQDESFDFPIEEVFVSMPLLRDEDKIDYKKILVTPNKKKIDAPPVILLSGDAGHGKTTLCRKITLEWCNSNACSSNKSDKHILSLNEYDLVLLIEVKRAKESGLSQYLKEILLKESLHHADEEKIYSFLSQLKVLIIIDAFDEKSKEAHKLVESVLNVLSAKKFLITTRPYYVREIQTILQARRMLYLNVQLQGFEDKGEMYIGKVWEILEKKGDKSCGKMEDFLIYLKKLPDDFQATVQIPLMNILLIYLWVNNRKLQTVTFTNLYKQVLELQKSTIVNKIREDINENAKYDDLQTVVSKLIYEVAKLCYENVKNITIFNKEMILHIKKEFKTYGFMDDKYSQIFISTLFLSIPSVRNCGKNAVNVIGEYEFLHKTQMEFLVALHIVSFLKLEEVRPILFQNASEIKENTGILKFIVGLLSDPDSKVTLKAQDIFKMLGTDLKSDYNVLWTLLSETMTIKDKMLKPNSEFCKFFTIFLREHNGSNWILNSDKVVSALKILGYIKIEIGCIGIDIDPHFNPHDPRFIFALLKVSKNFKPKRKVKVELFLRKHIQEVSREPSDDILKYFLGWANITKFVGHLTIPGIKLLKHECFNKLIHINVRLTSIEDLKLLIDSGCMCEKDLKKFCIIFDKPFETVPKLNDCRADVSVHFNYVDEKNIETAIVMLNKLKPSHSFFSVEMKCDINLETAMKSLPKIKNLIGGHLSIDSVHDIEEENWIDLKNKLGFHLKWNGYDI